MKTIGRRIVALGFLVGMGLAQPFVAQAGEHGGKEHAGHERDGASAAGVAPAAESKEATLLRQAADALRKGESRSDLAEQLEKLAENKAAR